MSLRFKDGSHRPRNLSVKVSKEWKYVAIQRSNRNCCLSCLFLISFIYACNGNWCCNVMWLSDYLCLRRHISENKPAHNLNIECKEKKEEIWLSPLTKALTPIEKFKKQRDNTKTPPPTSIKQRLRNDLGRSVGVTIAAQLVWLNRNNVCGSKNVQITFFDRIVGFPMERIIYCINQTLRMHIMHLI